MAEETHIDAPEATTVHRPSWGKRIAIGLLGLVVVLALLVGGVLLWLGTESGRGFVAKQVSALKFENGMTIHVGRIDGSIFNRMQLVDLTIGDPKGVFLSAPNVSVDYQPFEYLHKHLAIHDLTIPQAFLTRTPAFKPTPPATRRCCPI
jgi:translocation and assembly module TamB